MVSQNEIEEDKEQAWAPHTPKHTLLFVCGGLVAISRPSERSLHSV